MLFDPPIDGAEGNADDAPRRDSCRFQLVFEGATLAAASGQRPNKIAKQVYRAGPQTCAIAF
jgi:hypothetical protein